MHACVRACVRVCVVPREWHGVDSWGLEMVPLRRLTQSYQLHDA